MMYDEFESLINVFICLGYSSLGFQVSRSHRHQGSVQETHFLPGGFVRAVRASASGGADESRDVSALMAVSFELCHRSRKLGKPNQCTCLAGGSVRNSCAP